MRPRVRLSLEDASGQRCVDIVESDGAFGWAECRRDPEDGRGWQHLGGPPTYEHRDLEGAMAAARAAVGWLLDDGR